MLGKKLETMAVLSFAFIVGALVFAFAPGQVYAQDNSIQWIPFTVGHSSGSDDSAVTIYMTNGNFVVSNTSDARSITVRGDDGEDRTETSVFGSSTENEDGDVQTWAGTLLPGTYYVGVSGDVSTLSISGEAVNYTLPAPSTPVAEATAVVPVAQPVTTPTSTSQSVANSSNQIQWYVLTVGHVENRDASQVNIDITNGSFVVSNIPNAQSITVRDNDGENRVETSVFGSSSENEDGDAQIWEGTLIPGTYYVGVSGDVNTLSIWGDSVRVAPLSPSAQ